MVGRAPDPLYRRSCWRNGINNQQGVADNWRCHKVQAAHDLNVSEYDASLWSSEQIRIAIKIDCRNVSTGETRHLNSSQRVGHPALAATLCAFALQRDLFHGGMFRRRAKVPSHSKKSRRFQQLTPPDRQKIFAIPTKSLMTSAEGAICAFASYDFGTRPLRQRSHRFTH